MRRLNFVALLVLMVLVVFLSGCGSIWKTTKYVAWPASYRTEIPASQPGMVLPIHRAPQVWALCFLFGGPSGEMTNLFVPHATKEGRYTFTRAPIVCFSIPRPAGHPYEIDPRLYTAVPLFLPYPVDYTLLIFYQSVLDRIDSRVDGQGLYLEAKKIMVLPFSTTGCAFNRYVVDGRVFWADMVVELPWIKRGEYSQFKIHLTTDNLNQERLREIKKALEQ
ncbi:MAG: hypothetical protein ISS88_00335 [Candidatus Portnoybacteria bacterium]|nr:hypothetical protein [Candidatus Portnoybacteria bacterium]